MRVYASAPGKVTLFGEHAVVYGQPAIVASIDKRIHVYAEFRSDRVITIEARDLRIPGVIVTYRENEVTVETEYGLILPAISYLNKAIEIASKYLDSKHGVKLVVRSEMPVGAGLGTSAAVAVAAIAAYAYSGGYELSKDEIARLGWEVEKAVQGIASPMDTSITTYGGFMKIRYSGSNIEKESLAIDRDLPIIIAYVEREFKTRDMVQMVRERVSQYPQLYGRVVELIGEVVKIAEEALVKYELEKLGLMMNLNHGLLDSLGVSTRKLNEVVYAARSSGALGAKLTGAGGGGCAIALCRPEKIETVESIMRFLSEFTMRTSLGKEGVRVRVEKSI
ncbi:MAG: mevalonate kinase [Sulfolobales archaeon]|nr:mevalonate kinase [Sulfolobales archaeon]MDW8083178.1 mevalonate kinase [Sulfolobales archaeon]